MRTITAIAIVLLVLSGCGGGSSSSSGNVVTPGLSTQTADGTYCYAVGGEQGTMQAAVSFLDSIAPQIQGLVGNSTRVCIVFDQNNGAFYDGEIHMSPGEYMNRNLIHEYSHHCHMSNKIDSWWLLETIAEGVEVYLGYEQIPETCSFDIYNVDYTTQRHFGHFLMSTYGTDIFHRIVNCGYLDERGIEDATGEDWETIISKWRGGN